MYEAREKRNILAELQEASTSPADKFEGTFEYDMLAANALEFAKVEVELEEAYKAAFAETSWGEYLTMIAAAFGVDRKLATKAVGTVTLSGNGTVPAGSRFTTSKSTAFVTTEEVTISESGDVAIEAVKEGAAGNVAAGAVRNIAFNIPGITAVTNAEPTHDGYEEETDAELLERYYVFVRAPATSGNVWHYYNWAMSVEGVGSCRILPLWNGNGTVKVVIIDSNHKTASDDLKRAVYDYIETVRPIGATVTVDSPLPLPITVTAEIRGTFNAGTFIEEANAYFEKRYLNMDYVSEAQVIDIIMNQEDVIDCDNVRLNGLRRVMVGLEYLPSVEGVVASDLSL